MSRIADRDLHQLLRQQQSVLAAQWRHVISQSSFVSLDQAALEREVASLAKRTVDALLAEPLSRSEARAVGINLASLRYMTPETLRRMVESLGEQLAAALPDRELAALHPRLTALTAELITGFLEQERAMTMEQQNTMHQATLDSRRQAEEAIRASEARYRAVVTNVAEGIALADGVTHRILETNPALQRLLGYSEEELSGISLYEIVAHQRRSVDENIRQAVRKGQHDYAGGRFHPGHPPPALASPAFSDHALHHRRQLLSHRRALPRRRTKRYSWHRQPVTGVDGPGETYSRP